MCSSDLAALILGAAMQSQSEPVDDGVIRVVVDDRERENGVVARLRERFARALAGLGLEVLRSDANFLLFGEFADAKATWQRYLDGGVLVRDMGIPGYLRTTIGTDAENDVLIKVTRSLTSLKEN